MFSLKIFDLKRQSNQIRIIGFWAESWLLSPSEFAALLAGEDNVRGEEFELAFDELEGEAAGVGHDPAVGALIPLGAVALAGLATRQGDGITDF